MKLPLDFSLKLVFRLVFAGVILAAAFFPATRAIAEASNIKIKTEFLFPIAVILWGWIVLICDMRIYMLFEGRRYWPARLRELLLRSEQRRLAGLLKIVNKPGSDRRRYLEASVEYGLFPVKEDGTAYAEHPTRLGNLIDSFETYPNVKYGLDAIFYWYRLWVVLDKDLREELENAQSVVDSTIYVAFAFYVSGLVMLGYAGVTFLTHAGLRWLPVVDLPYVPQPGWLCVLGIACLAGGYLIYRLSLTAHMQYGELFKSTFDQFRSKLQFDDVLKDVGRIIDDPYLSFESRREKNRIIWRYLRWHRVRDAAMEKSFTPGEWKERHAGAARRDADEASP
jgi:hypothetical protein